MVYNKSFVEGSRYSSKLMHVAYKGIFAQIAYDMQFLLNVSVMLAGVIN
jgi:hypothetical protein